MTVIRLTSLCLCLLLQSVLTPVAQAWDATSHRLSAYVAWDAMLPAERDRVMHTLEKHPRFEQDFLEQMPANVMVGDEQTRQRWLFGQAAVWPDLARAFNGDELTRYHRANWHWIDGAWIRGSLLQGNVYVGADILPSIHGEAQGEITHERDAGNIVQALEFNLSVLENQASNETARAVALCWVLHLIGDIHQPLHSGALISSGLFPRGDRGGNGIPTRLGSLHSTWDEALRNQPFDDTLRRMESTLQITPLAEVSLRIDDWLQESRQIMQEFVYPDEVKAAVLRSERRRTALPSFALDEDYAGNMQAISEDRVTLSGIRLYLVLRELLRRE